MRKKNRKVENAVWSFRTWALSVPSGKEGSDLIIFIKSIFSDVLELDLGKDLLCSFKMLAYFFMYEIYKS